MSILPSALAGYCDVPCATLVEILRARAERTPLQRAYTFLLDGEREEAHLSYAELDQKARAIAAQLSAMGARGQRALLLYAPGLDYLAGFWGCLYAGVVAVPIYPPDMSRLSRTLPRLSAIAADAQATFALTTTPILSMAELLFDQAPELGRMRWMATDALDPADASLWRDPGVDADTLAFLQYTSGSTSTPRGVMLSHANLLHNLSLIGDSFGHSKESRGVIWLPPYHDMGLIGGILQPLFVGFPTVLFSPIDFLKRPLRWLSAISRYRATTSGGPNFAYDLCVRKIRPEEREGLDLSSWEVAFNGAEPVRPETLRRFAETFAPCGFRPEAFYPCYGLAEATLIVTGGLKSEAPILRSVDREALHLHRALPAPSSELGTQTLVGAGRALSGLRVAIADPETGEPLGPGQVGEIRVAGPSVARAYWNRPEESTRTFGSPLAGSAEHKPFLRTGDLGFIEGSELFVTGRLKDLIIVRGRNIYPQDIELVVEQSHPALRRGCGAAFAVPAEGEGEDRLVVVQEVEPRALASGALELGEVAQTIRKVVTAELELPIHAVLLVRAGSIPKTSSGKIQRHAAREEYLAGRLELLAVSTLAESPLLEQSEPEQGRVDVREALEAAANRDARRALVIAALKKMIAEALRIPSARIGAEEPIYGLGLDSLSAIEFKAAIEQCFGVDLALATILDGPSLSQLADAILARRDAAAAEGEAIAPVSLGAHQNEGEAQLSKGQQALWFLHELAPAAAAYHVPIVVRVRTNLDIAALERAFATLVGRHPVLRTTFAMGESGPVARVHDEMPLDFEAVETAGISEAELRERLIALGTLPFDLASGPLLRVRLFSLAEDEHVLAVLMHHIITDFWSISILAEELDQLYPALLRGETLELPKPAATYADYAHWQAEVLAGARGRALADYWKKALADLPALALPTDRKRPPVQTYNGRVHTARLGASLTGKLKALARARSITLHTLLVSAFQALLHRYTGQEDFPLGIVSAGREKTEFGRVVGYFVNPLVLRARPRASGSFSSLLADTQATLLDAFAHQDYPFGALVELVLSARDPSRSPLFQVMFAYQSAHRVDQRAMTPFALNIAGARAELAGLAIESVAFDWGVAQFDLTLSMGEAGDELVASFEYNTDLFEAKTVERMARHLEILLSGVTENPELPLRDLPMFSREERELFASGLGGARVDLSPEHLVPSRFAAQAARTPEATALFFEEQALSYGELARRIELLTKALESKGIGSGFTVGLCLTRSVEMVVAVLSVLALGATYVPIEPSYPRERLSFLLADAKAKHVLSQMHLVALLEEHHEHHEGVEILCLDRDIDWHAETPHTGPRPFHPLNLACLVYTSGSTGQPKGVMLEHRGLQNLVASFLDSYNPDERDRILPLTSVASASFVGEILPLLCAGGALVLPTEEEILDIDKLIALLARRAVTIVSTVPALVARLNAERSALGSIRLVLSGGEALVASDVARLVETCEVVNGYGLTETSVCSTYLRVSADDLRAQAWVPIGRPVINTYGYLLDRELRCVPIGCPGELYIAGEGLAQGYLRRPGLTAERFVPNPFRPGERMYRTGDLGRLRSNGVLEYLGRKDAQVKIRGHRVELGEIEATLKEHPGLREAFVCAREYGPSERRIVAYFVPGEPAPTVGALFSFLADRLPPHMLPSAFLSLPVLPLSPNGKVDEAALPLPEGERPELGAAYVPPESAIERQIAALWREILGITEVGLHDNFFELGGNSLLIARLHRRLREEMGADLALVDMFRYSTISAQSARLAKKADEPVAAQKIKDEAERRRAALGQRQKVAMARLRRPGK